MQRAEHPVEGANGEQGGHLVDVPVGLSNLDPGQDRQVRVRLMALLDTLEVAVDVEWGRDEDAVGDEVGELWVARAQEAGTEGSEVDMLGERDRW